MIRITFHEQYVEAALHAMASDIVDRRNTGREIRLPYANFFIKLRQDMIAQAAVVVHTHDMEMATAICEGIEEAEFDRQQIAHGKLTGAQYQEFRAGRKEEGLLIDPNECDLHWEYASTLDPYSMTYETDPQIGREYFASRKGAKDWVHDSDLPDATRRALVGREMR